MPASVSQTVPDKSASPDGDPARVGSGLLALLALAWLAFSLRSAWRAISEGADANVIVSIVVQALPAIVGGCLLAGAAVGLWGTRHIGLLRRLRVGPPALGRALAGTLTGLLVGLVVGGVVLFAFGTGRAIVALAVTVTVAGLLGGAAVALPAPPLAAGIAALLGVVVIATLIGLFQHPLTGLLGRGDTAASQYDAGVRLTIIGGLVEGLVAAAIAYQHLRRRAGGRAWVWPWFLLAGASAGLASLAKIGLAQLGGRDLTRIVDGFSSGDATYLRVLRESDLRTSLIVLFVGGIGAMIAIGRTLGRPAGQGAA